MRIHSLVLGLIAIGAALGLNPGVARASIGNPQAPQGGTIYLNLGGEPTTLNPTSSQDAYSQDVQSYILDSLLTRNDDTYEWQPALASKWEISKDGKAFTFHIREGVKWHDGQPLTAEDVKFSFDFIGDNRYQAAPLRPYYEGLEKVEIVDPQTVRFTAKEKYFRNFESAAGLNIVPKHIYGDPEKAKEINKELIGTGAYILDKYERGKRIVLRRNPEWWGRTAPEYKGADNFDQLVLRFVKEQTVSLEMLKKGDLDYEGFTPETYAERATGPEWGVKVEKIKVESLAPKPYGYIGWNLLNPIFQDRKVRIALAELVNRKLMIEKFRYGMSLPATGPWYRQSEYASKNVKPIEYDPKKALKDLESAGWSDPNKTGVLEKQIDGKTVQMRFTILTSNEDFMKYLTMYKEDASKVGVSMEVKYVEWNTFIKLLDEHKFDAVNLGWGPGSVDLDPKQIWHSASIAGGGSNFISYKSPVVDKLIDEARQELDKKKRLPMLRKVYETIAADAPYAFLFNDKYVTYGVTKRIGRPKDSFKYAVGTAFWWMTP